MLLTSSARLLVVLSSLCIVAVSTNIAPWAMLQYTDPLPVRVLTHNIRYATESPFKGEEVWAVRRTGLINELRFHTLYNQEAFICLQEVLHSQLLDIHAGLNNQSTHNIRSKAKEWSYIGVGRDDGHEKGEYSPIFYRPDIWECLMFKTVWLSQHPNVPSKGWDAASIRILTVGVFKHRASKQKLCVLNTHLDDQGAKSRYEAAKMIIEETKQLQATFAQPVILTGDLNSQPHHEAYQALNDPTSPLVDLHTLTPKDSRYGHQMTFTGFGYENHPPTRIDFVHVSKPLEATNFWKPQAGVVSAQRHLSTHGYSVVENKYDDGIYVSDHRAVVGDLLLT